MYLIQTNYFLNILIIYNFKNLKKLIIYYYKLEKF